MQGAISKPLKTHSLKSENRNLMSCFLEPITPDLAMFSPRQNCSAPRAKNSQQTIDYLTGIEAEVILPEFIAAAVSREDELHK